MKTTIQAINFNSKDELNEFTEKKLKKLEKYNSVTKCNVIFKLANNHKTEHFDCEIVAHIPGKEVFSKSEGTSFEAALEMSIKAVEKQIEKHLEKSK